MKTRKSISVKPEVHEVFRKAAIKLSTKEKRVTIAELVEDRAVELKKQLKI